jgi:ABC-type molybdenum transport system ATPase subunit/photorepair protein PhrA
VHLDELAGMKSSGWPSSRTKSRWRTLGASMRLPTSRSGKWMGTRTPGNAIRRNAYNKPMPTPALHIADLRKVYDNGVEALKGVSLSVQPGDFFALLGPNGAGKSTLIGVVSLPGQRLSGRAEVFGIDVAQQRSAAMRQIGWCRRR